jgi:hypothetical protein
MIDSFQAVYCPGGCFPNHEFAHLEDVHAHFRTHSVQRCCCSTDTSWRFCIFFIFFIRLLMSQPDTPALLHPQPIRPSPQIHALLSIPPDQTDRDHPTRPGDPKVKREFRHPGPPSKSPPIHDPRHWCPYCWETAANLRSHINTVHVSLCTSFFVFKF